MEAETQETATVTEHSDIAPEGATSSETGSATEQIDYLANVLDKSLPMPTGFTGVETPEVEETSAETDTRTESETGEGEQAQTEGETETQNDAHYIVKTKVGEQEKQWDLRDETQRTNLVNRIQQLDHSEKKFSDAKRMKEDAENLLAEQKRYYVANANKYLFNVMQGKTQLERPVYDDFVGMTDSEQSDREAFQNADKQYLETQKALLNYENGWKNANASFSKQLADFATKHPDITEPLKWFQEQITPYYQSLEGYGMKPYPEDTMEMLYWWSNKSKFEESIREDERKKQATKKPATVQTTKKINVEKKAEQKDFMEKMLDNAFGKPKGFKLR